MCIMELPLQTMDLRLRDNRHANPFVCVLYLICSATIARFVNIERKICKLTLTNMNMKKRRPATISVRVTEEEREMLASIAAEERRTISQVVLFMIEEGLARRAKRSRK
jgi:hypothetical protein